MDDTLISVIIPVYNVEKYLDDCIKSVLSQTYNNLEIILINDGSTDRSLEICSNYLFDKRIKIINKKNAGLSEARQAGLNNLSGKYFCTVDSDDYLEPYFVERLYKEIKKYDADICVCARIDFTQYSRREIPLNIKDRFIFELNKEDLENSFHYYTKQFVMSDSWNKLYRTNFVKQTNVRFSLDSKFNGTDLLFNHLILLHLPKICLVNEPLYHHRIVETSRVHRKNKQMQRGFYLIIEHIFTEIKKLKFDNKILVQLGIIFVKFSMIAGKDIYIENDSYRNKKDKFKQFLEEYKNYMMKHPDIIVVKRDSLDTSAAKIFYTLMEYSCKTALIAYYWFIVMKSRLRSLYGK